MLKSPWGRLFRNWETLTPTRTAIPEVGEDGRGDQADGDKALVRSIGILGTCIAEAPEFATRRARGGDAGKRCERAEHRLIRDSHV